MRPGWWNRMNAGGVSCGSRLQLETYAIFLIIEQLCAFFNPSSGSPAPPRTKESQLPAKCALFAQRLSKSHNNTTLQNKISVQNATYSPGKKGASAPPSLPWTGLWQAPPAGHWRVKHKI